MANQEQMELLRRGVEGWNRWRCEYPDVKVDLRGANFKGADLKSANFSGADIRGAKFTNTILRGADFTEAKAGLQRRWRVLQSIVAFIMSVIFNFIATLFAYWNITPAFIAENIKRYTIFPGFIILCVFIVVYLAIALRGLTTKVFAMIALCVAFAFASAFASVAVVANAGVAASAGEAAGIVCISGAIAAICAVAAIVTGAIAAIFPVMYVIAVAVVFAAAATGSQRWAVESTVLTVLFTLYSAWQVSKENEKFALARSFVIALSTLGCTNFEGADLTGATFSGALLKNTNFADSSRRKTNLVHVCWRGAKRLNRAQVGNSILAERSVRELLVTGKGINQNFEGANLQGAKLKGFHLNGANLKRADLTEAILAGADLQNTNLVRTQAIATDFTGAYLTGACIEAWNIDNTTKLQDVDAKFVYLLENEQERRPSSSEFAPGEFTTLLQKALNTVDLIFCDGIDWQAFFQSFQELRSQYNDENLSIQAIEKKSGGAFVIRLEVPAEADKAVIEQSAKQIYETKLQLLETQYQQQLQLKDVEIDGYRRENTNLLGIVNLLGGRPINSIAIAGSQSMGDRNIHMGSGNYNENINGNYIQGNYINMSQDLTQAAQQIQDLLQQLQNQGVTVEDSQQQVATDMAKQAETNPAMMGKLVLWGKAMANKASETTVSEAAKMVLTLALRAAGIPLP